MKKIISMPYKSDAKKEIENSLYDCYSARVLGERIHCAHDHRLGRFKDGSLHINELIRGTPLVLTVCQQCPDFEQMDGGKVLKEDRGWMSIAKITLSRGKGRPPKN